MSASRVQNVYQATGIAWALVVWGWSLYYTERFDKGEGQGAMVLLYSIPCIVLISIYAFPWRRPSGDVADFLAYGTLILCTFMLYDVGASRGDGAGYMHFFELVALWGGAFIS